MFPRCIVFPYNENESNLKLHLHTYTAQKMKLSIKDFFSKCDQICRKLWIWSHLLKKSLMESFIFCANCCLIIMTTMVTKPNKNAWNTTFKDNPAIIYLFQDISKNTVNACEICSQRRHQNEDNKDTRMLSLPLYLCLIVNFEHI